MSVRLTGAPKHKHVWVQPERVVARNSVVDYSGTFTPSSHLVTPVMLVD